MKVCHEISASQYIPSLPLDQGTCHVTKSKAIFKILVPSKNSSFLQAACYIYQYVCIPFHCLSNLTRLHSIKLPDHQAMITQLFQTLTKDANHLVCGLLVDVAKPVLDVQVNHLLHHAFMGDTGWITIRVAVTSSRVVHCSMARCISNVNQYLN